MKVLNKKLSKNSGFTIVEMLIVVAIIAILIAISIPMFSAALERTRHAVDDANKRDAISLGNIEYLTRQNDKDFKDGLPALYVYEVDESDDYQGHLKETGTPVAAKCTGKTGAATCDPDNHGKSLYVVIKADGDVLAGFYSSAADAKTAGGITG